MSSTAATQPTSAAHTHFRTCNLCEAMCGLEITLEDDQIKSIKGDKANEFSKGHICPKAVAMQDIYADPDRLKMPVKRTANGWEEISWKAAYDEIETRIKAIQKKYGRNSVGTFVGNPTVHNLGSLLKGPAFFKSLGSKNMFSATSVDQLPHHFASNFMFGHSLMIPIPDIDRTDHLLIMGANPVASNGSMMTAAGVRNRLKDIQKRGGKVTVIDPRKTETADMADSHHFIKPSTDVVLLLAMINEVINTVGIAKHRTIDFSDGLEKLPALVAGYTLEKAASITGISAIDIQQLVKDFVKAPTAVLYGRMGLSVQQFGAACQWLINVFNLITGNLDSAGGTMFTTPALDILAKKGNRGPAPIGRWGSRVGNHPEFLGELPVVALLEEMTTEGEGQIKAMFTAAGNPVLSTPQGDKLGKAMDNLEFMVSIDIFINETTCKADIILPPATGLETAHFDVVFNALAVRNTVHYSEPLFDKGKESKYDWEIYQELHKRLGKKAKSVAQTATQFIERKLTPQRMLAIGLKAGPYGKANDVTGEPLTFKRLQAEKHGIDLGPLVKRLPKRLFTLDKRINALPAELVADMDRINSHFLSDNSNDSGDFDLTLIGRRHLRTNNSWMHNSKRLMKGKNRCTLMMHSNDASARKLTNDVLVEVASSVGTVSLPVEITDTVMPGVVSIPHGYGHKAKGMRLRVAEAHAGVSINELTDGSLTDTVCGNAALNGVPVKVSLSAVASNQTLATVESV